VRETLADTFYWIALTVPTEAAHAPASQFTGKIVTTDEVLSEYLTFFSAAPDYIRSDAGETVQDILQDGDIRVIPQSRKSFLDGLALYRARPDKGYSLNRLHSDADHHAQGRADRGADERQAFRTGRFSGAVQIVKTTAMPWLVPSSQKRRPVEEAEAA
jgi:uncharacterized protein